MAKESIMLIKKLTQICQRDEKIWIQKIVLRWRWRHPKRLLGGEIVPNCLLLLLCSCQNPRSQHSCGPSLSLSLSLSLLHNNRHTNTFVYCPTVPNVCFLVLLSAAITTHAHTHHPSLLSLSFYIPTSVYLLNTLSLPISFTYTLSLCLFFSRFTYTYYHFLSTFLHLSIS